MSEQDRYTSPFSERYASRAMQQLFSARHRAGLWRRLWLWLAEAEQALGLAITKEQLQQMREHLDDTDFASVAGYEQALRHDVMAHLKAFADQAPLAGPIMHLGATSCYVGDNADILILRDAMKLIEARLVMAARKLSDFAGAYRDLPVLGYTHFQPAQPTTLGKRATLWLHDLLSDLAQVSQFLDALRPLGSKGTTGTQASFLQLFEGDYDKVKQLDRLIAEKMGFSSAVAVSGQTYSRKLDAWALSILSQIAQSAHKFSNDIRLLAHLKEVEEPFEKQQVGSSAMAYKRNPMRCERMAALSRFLIVNQQNAALTAAEQWLERTLDDSANRRIALAEGFLAADGLMTLYNNVAGGLVVYPRMAHRHLMAELPFMATENILMDAVKQGGDRQALHERIRQHAQAAAQQVKLEGRPNDLIARIAADPAFQLDEAALERTLSPERYTGCASMQVDDYLNGEVKAALSRYEGMTLPEEQLKV